MDGDLTRIQDALNAFLFGESWAPVALIVAIGAVVALSRMTKLGRL